ncbi:MAG TPA: transglutaminase-like domain-containing protein, partial [Gemmatales bacterium]|nr:transglutaminase-like domain-containing protein [Gemmatales bacterium]
MVPLSVLFRFSLYLSLFVSTATLGYAELIPLPETGPFYVVIGLVLLLAARLERRLTLSIQWSNVVGAAIIAGFGIWVVLSYRKGFRSTIEEAAELEFARWLLPHGGPLLSVLLVVKLLRPKGIRDYWMLHLLGLMQVVLASVLAMSNKLDRDAPLFPLMVLVYFLSFVWVLLNFTLYFDGVPDRLTISPSPSGGWRQGVPPQETITRPRLRPVLGWFLASLLLGLVLFFVVPRGSDGMGTGLRPTSSRVGFKPSVDLTTEGPLGNSEERVFRVSAQDSLGQEVRLLPDLRWRGVVCSKYAEGLWSITGRDSMGINTREVFKTASAPPAGMWRLSYTMDVRRVRTAGDLREREMGESSPGQTTIFLMETLRLRGRPGEAVGYPRVRIPDDAPRADRAAENITPYGRTWVGGIGFNISTQQGALWAMLPPLRPARDLYYEQEIAIGDVNLTEWDEMLPLPRFGDSSPFDSYLFGEHPTLLQVPDGLQRSGHLKRISDELLRAEGVPPDASPQQKAKALERALGQSDRFAYSSFRRRQDTQLDPNEDFLLNVKSGHCERFASALALMLRVQGIPSRLVIGFRGGDWNNPGRYLEVRELHAHAWVEAAIELETTRTAANLPRRVRWLSLDPTPGNEDLANREQGFFIQNLSFAKMIWEFFILDFSGDMQRRQFLQRLDFLGLHTFAEWIASLGWIGVLLVIALFIACSALAFLLVWLLRVLRERWRAQRTLSRLRSLVIPFYQRLLDWLARRRLVPRPAQTAAELAARAREQLLDDPATAPVAEVPARVVDHYYAVRFGAASMPEQSAAAEAEMKRLEGL